MLVRQFYSFGFESFNAYFFLFPSMECVRRGKEREHNVCSSDTGRGGRKKFVKYSVL